MLIVAVQNKRFAAVECLIAGGVNVNLVNMVYGLTSEMVSLEPARVRKMCGASA